MRATWIVGVASSISIGLFAACHSEQDPFEDLVDLASTTEAEGDAETKKPDPGNTKPDKDTTTAPDNTTTQDPGTDSGTGTGGGGEDKKECTLPARYIVLGDAIPEAETGLGGPDDPANSFLLMRDYIKSKYKAANLTYENLAKAGTATADVPGEQLDKVDTSKGGHVLVNIHVGGNDLAAFILKSDQAAQDAFDSTMSDAEADWQKMFEFFEDKSKFPDGATFIINTQFNPFDDCTELHGLFRVSDVKIGLMKQFNARLAALADARDNAVVADHVPVFLGHGHHYDNDKCPHYEAGSEYWMVGGTDLTHINEKGYAGMTKVFEGVADTLYAGCPERE